MLAVGGWMTRVGPTVTTIPAIMCAVASGARLPIPS